MTGIDDLDTPVLVIDRRRMLENIRTMAEAMSGAGAALRPHFKTSKMIEVARLQLEAGAVGFTCATPAEVDALLSQGMSDVFWANAPATPAKARFAAEANRRGRVIVGIDSLALADALSTAAKAEGVVIPVRVEIDTGLRRTGVTGDEALALAAEIDALAGVKLEGVYTHEGQLASIRGTRDELRDAGHSASRRLVEVATLLRAAGHTIDSVSVGSTPGWDSAPFVDGVTEARPGTYVFFDANQWRLGSADLGRCALHLHATVVSAPRSGEVVIDAGIKALSSDRSNRGDVAGTVLDADDAPVADATFSRAYEEHGVLEGRGTLRWKVGDRVRVLPNHACGVVNMWSRVVVVDGDRVVDIWTPVARH